MKPGPGAGREAAPGLTEHAERNRRQWDEWSPDYVAAGRRAWMTERPCWGAWRQPDTDVGVLGDMSRFAGRDVVELGCGTAYFSAWFARAGARAVGIDNSPRQLEVARALQQEFGPEFPLLLGSAEQLPFEDGSFDVAFSEYGASIWCDPYLWIPEAARVLRPGGELVFLANSVLSMLCMPNQGRIATSLQRPQFGMRRFEWDEADDDSVEFHLPHGEMIDLLASHGLQVERLVEVQVPPDAPGDQGHVDASWASRWPAEEIWTARRRG